MELRDYLRVLRAHWLGIALLLVLSVAVALGISFLQPRLYTAEASGFVRASAEVSATSGALAADQLARNRVTSFVDMGSWRSVAEYTIDELDLDTTPDRLVQQVSVTNPLDTVIIRVEAQAPSPEAARDLAETWIRGMAREIDRTDGDGREGSAAVGLYAGDSARLPTAPSSPNLRLNIALGLLAGLALGLAYAAVRHVLDRRVHDPRDIERVSGIPVIGTLPMDRTLSGGRRILSLDDTGDSASPLAEALRTLRTNVQFMDVDNPPRSIVVTSPLPGDGKSTLASNLAVTLAAAGQHVVLVDADLRRPMATEIFQLPDAGGLTDVLSGRAEIGDVVHTVDPQGNLAVLTAGRIPPNPSEVVGSQRMRDLIATLSEHALVVIDSPPIIPVTDAASLTTAADGAIIVLTAGKTTYEMLEKARTNLDRAHARTLGIVVNRVPRSGAQAVYYGYQYKGDYVSPTADR